MTGLKHLVEATETSETADNLKEVRKAAVKTLHTKRAEVFGYQSELEILRYEIDDADSFINHLGQALHDFEAAADTFSALGHLEFEFCPACFSKVDEKALDHCQLCGERSASDEGGSRTLAVKLDLQMQLRESIAIQNERHVEKKSKSSRLRVAKVELRKVTASADTLQPCQQRTSGPIVLFQQQCRLDIQPERFRFDRWKLALITEKRSLSGA